MAAEGVSVGDDAHVDVDGLADSEESDDDGDAPLALWFTVEEWESLREDDLLDAAPLAAAFAVLCTADAVVDVVVVLGPAAPAEVSARVALRGAYGVQLAYVRTPRVEGVRLAIFPLRLLGQELADVVPSGPTQPHPARHRADYPYEMFLAGLTATARDPAVLAEVCAEIARASRTAAPDAARQLTHLVRDGLGRLEALVMARAARPPAPGTLPPRVSTVQALPVSWALTTSGWFALSRAPGNGATLRVRPATATDLAAALAPSLACVLPAISGG